MTETGNSILWLKRFQMNSFLKYLRVWLIKALKSYHVIVIFTIILALCAGIMLGNIFKDRSESEANAKFPIGLVGDTSDSYLGIGVFAVQNFDVSKDYAEFIEMSEDEAKKQLKDNKILGYVIIPDGFIKSVLYGDNIDIKFISNKKPAILETLLIEEICTVVSDLVVGSQNGIYGYSDFLKELSSVDRSKLIDKINIEYLSCVFNRNSVYDINTVGYSNSLTFEVYYISAFVVILILLWGICCSGFMVKNSYSFYRSVILGGRGVATQIFAEFIAFASVILVNAFLVLLLLGVFSETYGLNFGAFAFIDSLSSCLGLWVSFIPVILLLCSLQHLLFEISNGIIGSVILQVFAVISLSYLSGFFLPIYSLPPLLQSASKFLPTTVAFNYISAVFTEKESFSSIVWIFVWTIIFVASTLVIRKAKVRSDRYS